MKEILKLFKEYQKKGQEIIDIDGQLGIDEVIRKLIENMGLKNS